MSSGLAPVAQFLNGPSGSQTKSGACRSEGLITSEHVPDRLGELTGEVNLGDLRSALAAETAFGALVALAVERVRGGRDRGLHQPPAQILRAVLGQRAAPVHLPGLLHARAQAGVAVSAARDWRYQTPERHELGRALCRGIRCR